MFENFKVFETELAGRPLVVETGKMAQLANGEALVRYGETVVHVAVTASEKPRDGIDFFPLSVDFEEKLYAVGKIPGSFLKREGRPSEKAILASRVDVYKRQNQTLCWRTLPTQLSSGLMCAPIR